MVANAQFAGWPQIDESIEARADRLAADEQYAREVENADFDAASKWWREALWGIGERSAEEGAMIAQEARNAESAEADEEPEIDFEEAFGIPNEESADVDETENSVASSESTPESIETPAHELAESEDAPVIRRFEQNGNITSEEAQELITAWINSDNFHSLIDKSNLPEDRGQDLTQSLEYIHSWNTTKIAQAEIPESFPDIFKDFENPDPEKMSPFTIEAFREVTEHYIPSEEQGAKEANLWLAIEMSANDIAWKAVLNLNPGNRESFAKAMEIAHNTDAEVADRFAALTEISQIVNGDQAIKGGWRRQAELFRNSQAKAAQLVAENRAYFAGQEQMVAQAAAQAQRATPQEERLPQEETPSNGDIFTAWVLDGWSEQWEQRETA